MIEPMDIDRMKKDGWVAEESHHPGMGDVGWSLSHRRGGSEMWFVDEHAVWRYCWNVFYLGDNEGTPYTRETRYLLSNNPHTNA